MPPRLPAQLRRYGRQGDIFEHYTPRKRQPACLFCSFALDSTNNRGRTVRQPRKRATPTHVRRFEAAAATATTTKTEPATVIAPTDAAADPRKELASVLLELQKHAAQYIDLSRLQLALDGLRQKPGDESMRVAILGLAHGPASSSTAKDVLRLLLADPLKDAEPWERELEQHDLTEPMMIRIGAESQPAEPDLSVTKENILREIRVSSATLNGHKLEILFAETSPILPVSEKTALDRFEDATLVPTIEVRTSETGEHKSIATPVHKTLIVADGLHGAASLMVVPSSEYSSVLKYAVNIPEYKPVETIPLPFTPIDTNIAKIGLALVRKDISNAIEYEHLWFQSNVPKLVEWLKADILTTPDNVTKPPVRELIASLLRHTSASIRAEENRIRSTSTSPINSSTQTRTIEKALSEWAESAHSELQEQLDLAFSSKRWRKLRWWKLFWRVDDVSMLTSDILAQKFLPNAERNSIFLSGRMAEAGVSLFRSGEVRPRPDYTVDGGSQSMNTPALPNRGHMTPSRWESNWPKNIPNTRSYLQTETVPALQALAQKLVLQTLGTSGLMTALGALVYIGTLSTTLYEAGAVAALGLVWSMKRMQKHWEAARNFWEGEVREEGRKAVRGAGAAMASAIIDNENPIGQDVHVEENLERANKLVLRAEKLLEKLK
ncbi:hypothetical protein F4777DRAFT_97403 [Nemania sp. FL0916]|nr:hypothetical protein F4777DRAFT_97403 [Nemania sp. FL0916]